MLDGKGYVHTNIPAAITALREIAASAHIETEVSDDPGAFTNANLRRFKAIVFANTNNEAFESDAQRDAFRKFVSESGGIVGIHSATGSERNWPYFQAVMGGKLRRQPKDPEVHDPGRRSRVSCNTRVTGNIQLAG